MSDSALDRVFVVLSAWFAFLAAYLLLLEAFPTVAKLHNRMLRTAVVFSGTILGSCIVFIGLFLAYKSDAATLYLFESIGQRGRGLEDPLLQSASLALTAAVAVGFAFAYRATSEGIERIRDGRSSKKMLYGAGIFFAALAALSATLAVILPVGAASLPPAA